MKNRKMPWKAKDGHILTKNGYDDKAVAFNVGQERAEFIVNAVNNYANQVALLTEEEAKRWEKETHAMELHEENQKLRKSLNDCYRMIYLAAGTFTQVVKFGLDQQTAETISNLLEAAMDYNTEHADEIPLHKQDKSAKEAVE